MRPNKKYWRLSMTVDIDLAHDVATMVDGRAYDVTQVPVVFKTQEPDAARATTARQLIEQAMEIAAETTERQITVVDLRAAGKRLNVAMSSIYSTLYALKKDGKLISVTPGVYQLAPLAIGSEAAKPLKVPTGNRGALLAMLKPGVPMSRVDLVKKFVAKGGKAKAADAALYQLTARGWLTKVGTGQFQLAKG